MATGKVIGRVEVSIGNVRLVDTEGNLRDSGYEGLMYEGEQIYSDDPEALFQIKYDALPEATAYDGVFRVLADGSVIAGLDGNENMFGDDIDFMDTAAGGEVTGSSAFLEDTGDGDGSDLLGFGRGADGSVYGDGAQGAGEVSLDDQVDGNRQPDVVDINANEGDDVFVGLDTFETTEELSPPLGEDGEYRYDVYGQGFTAEDNLLDSIEMELFAGEGMPQPPPSPDGPSLVSREPEDSIIVVHVREVLSQEGEELELGETIFSSSEINLTELDGEIVSIEDMGLTLVEGQTYVIVIESVSGTYQWEYNFNSLEDDGPGMMVGEDRDENNFEAFGNDADDDGDLDGDFSVRLTYGNGELVIYESHDDTDETRVDDTIDDVTTTFTGIITPATDADVDDTHTYEVVEGTLAIDGELQVDEGITATIALNPETGNWEYTIEGDANSLAAGETVTITFDYVAIDDSGVGAGDFNNEPDTSEPATITITVTGTNDQPIVQEIPTVTQDEALDGVNVFEGTLPDVIDADDSDTHTFHLVGGEDTGDDLDAPDVGPMRSEAIGDSVDADVTTTNELGEEIDLDITATVTLNQETGEYEVEGDFNALALGERATVTFEYYAVDDNEMEADTHNETSTSEPELVTMIIEGTNDQPVITDINANGIGVSGTLLTDVQDIATSGAEGSVQYTYFTVDETTTLTINANSTGSPFIDTYLYLLRNDGDLSSDDYVAHNDDWSSLNSQLSVVLEPGEYVAAVGGYSMSLSEVISGINNNYYTTGEITLTFNANHEITLHDSSVENAIFYETHDADDVVGAIDTQADETTSFTGTIDTVQDDDDTDTHTYEVVEGSISGLPEGATATIDYNAESGEWEYTIDGDFNYLDMDEVATITFDYVAVDDSGVGEDGDANNEPDTSEPATITLNITGTNDQPIVEDVTLRVSEESLDDVPMFDGEMPRSSGLEGTPMFEDARYEGSVADKVSDDDNNDGGDNTHTFAIDDGTLTLSLTTTNQAFLSLFDLNDLGRFESFIEGMTEGVLDVSFMDDDTNGVADSVTVATTVAIDQYFVDIMQQYGILNIAMDENGAYSVQSPLFNMLGASDSVTIGFDYRATDNADVTESDGINELSESEAATVTLTIMGTNDQPVAYEASYEELESALADTAVGGVNTTFSDSLPGSDSGDILENIFTRMGMDEDVFDRTTLTFHLDAEPVTTEVEEREPEDGVDVVDSAQTVVIVNADGTFTVANPTFDNLSAGESATVTFQYFVDDASGAVSTPDNLHESTQSESVEVSVTIVGTNDQPVIQPVSFRANESHDDVAYQDGEDNTRDDSEVLLSKVDGVLSATDDDVNNTHKFTAKNYNGGGYEGSRDADDFRIDNVDFYKNGPNGNDHNVKVMITSDNVDVDNLDVTSLTFFNNNRADSQVNFEVEGDFTALGVGETATITFKYMASDGEGFGRHGDEDNEASKSEPKLVTITIMGTNDQPVIENIETRDALETDLVAVTYGAAVDVLLSDMASDPQEGSALKAVFDTADGDTVSFDWSFASGDVFHDAASVIVDGVIVGTVNTQSGVTSGTFTTDALSAGEHTITVVVVNDRLDDGDTAYNAVLTISNLVTDGIMISSDSFGAITEDGTGIHLSANSNLPVADLDAFIDLEAVTYENAVLGGNIDDMVEVTDDDDNDGYSYIAFDDQIVDFTEVSNGVGLITTPIRVSLDGDGNYTLVSSSFDKLGEGESVTVSFDVQVQDDSGVGTGTANDESSFSEIRTVTIVINGTNDSPVLNSVTTDTNIMETDLTGIAENSVLAGTLVVNISDEDMNDSHDFVAFGAEVAVVVDNHGVIVGDTIVSLDPDGNYTVTNESFNNLGVNETVTVSFDVQVTDGTTGANSGESAISNTQTVTLNISGTNDQPVVQGVSVAIVDSGAIALNGDTTTSVDYWNFSHAGGELSVDMLSEMNNNGNPWVQDGTGVYNDLNGDGQQTSLDVMVRVYELNADGSRGALVGTNDDSNNPGADGSLWNRDSYLSLDLTSGEYQLVVGAWNLSEADVNSGANDVDHAGWHYEGPYQLSLTGADGVQMVDQNVIFEALNGNTVFENDLPPVADEDTNDTHVYSLVNGTVAISDASITDFSVTVDANGHYILDGDFNSLAIGQRATVTFDYVADDQQGADGTGLDENSISEPATVTIVVVGTNDGAIITVPNGQDSGDVAEDTIFTVDGHLVVSDVDAGEAVFSTDIEADPANTTSYGTFTIDAGGAWLYTLDNDAVQVLGDEIVIEKYVVKSIDGTASQTVDIMIHGQNDAPVITQVSGNNSVVTENDVIDGTVTETTVLADIDATDVDGPTMTYAITSGDPYGYFEIDNNGVVTLTQYGADEVAASHVNDQIFSLGIEVSDGTLDDTTTVTIVVDDNFVDIPAIDLPASMDSGISDSDDITNNALPTLDLGNIAADALHVQIIDASSVLQAQAVRTSVDGMWVIDNAADGALAHNIMTGIWTFTPDSVLADGTYSYSVIVTDDAGNVDHTTLSPLVIDTTPPTIDISGIADNVNETLSDVDLGQITATDANAVTLSIPIGSGFTLDGDGNLTLNGEIDFEDNSVHTVTVTATDTAGNESTQDISVNVNNITGSVLYTSADIMHTFNGNNSEGWTGQGAEHIPSAGVLGWFDQDSDTRSQTFDLSDSAGENANISFDLGIYGRVEGITWVSTGWFGHFEPYGNGWEGNDTFRVRVTDSDGNPIEVENFSPDGNHYGNNMISLDLDISVPQDGEITVEFKSVNTDDHGRGLESWSIDNFQIDGESREVLSFDTNGTIDVATLIDQANDFENASGDSVAKPNSLDEIDLSNSDNTLSNITLADVLDITDSDNLLRITGDSNDTVRVDSNEFLETTTQINIDDGVRVFEGSVGTQTALLTIDDDIVVEY